MDYETEFYQIVGNRQSGLPIKHGLGPDGQPFDAVVVDTPPGEVFDVTGGITGAEPEALPAEVTAGAPAEVSVGEFAKKGLGTYAMGLKGLAQAWVGIGGDLERLVTGLARAAEASASDKNVWDAFLMGLGKDSTLLWDTEEAKKILDKFLPAGLDPQDFGGKFQQTTMLRDGGQGPMRVGIDGYVGERFGEFFAPGGQLKAGIKLGKALRAGLQRLPESVRPGPISAGLSIEPVTGEQAAAMLARKAPLSAQEKTTLAAAGDSKAQRAAADEARRVKGNYPKAEGWEPITIDKVESKATKAGDSKIKVKFKKIAYGFEQPPGKTKPEVWLNKMSSRIVDEVAAVVERAKSGDQAASEILDQANWYRSMRDRLRSEFGGIGDVFADVLGATSAQTDVKANFDNAIEILRRFSRGDFDAEIKAYSDRVSDPSLRSDPTTLTKEFKAGEFPLITKASGALFNTNSPAATGALLDMFRAVRAGDAPKTPNFTGNLIGLTNEATIDVWAARMLRRLAGKPTIPPPAEQGVTGTHRVGSTLFEPKVGGEFGFGQAAFKSAADTINSQGLISGVRPDLGNLGPDDLQAVAWFIEKERWTKNNWTTKAGEGGSLDYEMSLAGQPDAERVNELRSILRKGSSTDAEKEAARQELEQLAASPERYTLGVSSERPNDVPSDYRQAELAAEFDDVVRDDASVITYKANSTFGRFMKSDERALDAEFIVQKNFDPSALTRRLVEMGKQYDQDSVFIAKAVPTGTSANARPGIELYFKQRQSPDFVRKITDKLAEYGIDGFTFITDMRAADRPGAMALSGSPDTAGLTGVRLQYVPEFDDAFDPARRAEIMAEKQRLFNKVLGDIISEDQVSDARVVWYDTKVFFRSDYDAYLGTDVGRANPKPGSRPPGGADATQPNSSGAGGTGLPRNVSDRLGAEPGAQARRINNNPGGEQ